MSSIAHLYDGFGMAVRNELCMARKHKRGKEDNFFRAKFEFENCMWSQHEQYKYNIS